MKRLKNFHNKRAVAFYFLLLAGVLPVHAASLVNINTADKAALTTLNGIGDSKAQAIIDYRVQHGAFQKIEDIQNVSGIGAATYNNIKDFITVEGNSSQTTAQATSTATTTPTQAQTQTPPANGSSPPTIAAHIVGDSEVVAGAGSFFSGEAYNAGRELLLGGVRYVWNFGDGATAEGRDVAHTYNYPGRYVVELDVAYSFSSAMTRLVVVAGTADVGLRLEADNSLVVLNRSKDDLDVGLWILTDGTASFYIPEDTIVLAGEGLRFAPGITKVAGTQNSSLLYPNGAGAASAVASAGSPLRGQRVAAQKPLAPKKAAVPKKTTSAEPAVIHDVQLPAAQLGAAVANSTTGFPWWASGIGLAGLIGLGVAATWYTRQHVTKPVSEEFDIS